MNALPFDHQSFTRLEILECLDVTASGVAFTTNTGDMVEVSTYGEGVFRFRVGSNTRPDYGLVQAFAEPGALSKAVPGAWTLNSGTTQLEITGKPLKLRLLRDGQEWLASITDQHFRGHTRLPAIGKGYQGLQWTAAFALTSGEPVYGLGEKFGPLDKRGQLIVSQVEDALGVNTELSYKNAPFCWSPGPAAKGARAWGLFVHTPGKVAHGVGYPPWSHRSYVVVVDDEALDLFFIEGSDPAEVIDRYTELTGKAPEVPLWSLGLWVSRAYYATPADAIKVAQTLRAKRIPCDVLTLDGRAAWDVQTRFDFQWDPERFPDPRGALREIKRHALRVCVWEYPYVSVHSRLFSELALKGYLLTSETGEPYVFRWDVSPATTPFGEVLTPLPESGIVDFTNPDAYAFWRDAHEPLFAAGVDVIKSDFGEQVPDDVVAFNGDSGWRLHNVFPLLYNRCVFDATRKFGHGEGAPIVWARAGWTGSQRFPLQWGGDPQSDWEGLAASVRGGLSWGMTGAPYYSSDIGGFYGSEEPSPELFVRWLQMSVFSSHMRLHGIGAREPWAFGDEAEKIARQWIEFRYRLLPYLQATVRQAMATGSPVMRAMALAFPRNALTRGFETQFMCGDALLVAPITASGGEVEIALPPGQWYDLASRQKIAGRQIIRYRAPLDRFPVFGREGYILPLGPVIQYTGEVLPDRPLNTLWVFGRPTQALEGFAQAEISIADDAVTVKTASGVSVEVFGDANAVRIGSL